MPRGKEANYTTTGTTAPIRIPKDQGGQTIKKGEGYFLIKVHSAQAAFSGSFWEKARQLIVTSQVTVNHPAFGDDATRAIQQSRSVDKGKAEQLGLATNLVDLVPATMDQVYISIDFLLDKENRLASLTGLINDGAFVSAVSFVPGGPAVAKTVGKLAQKIVDSFLSSSERQPILQFAADFNLDTGELSDAYYVILGTRDEDHPLPRPLPRLEVKERELLADGIPVRNLSFIILDVATVPARTKDVFPRGPWYERLSRADTLATRIANNPFSSDKERRKTWDECLKLIEEAHALLAVDSLFLPKEAKAIIQEAYTVSWDQIFGQTSTTLGAPPTLNSQVRDLLGVESLATLRNDVQIYTETHARVLPKLKSLGLYNES